MLSQACGGKDTIGPDPRWWSQALDPPKPAGAAMTHPPAAPVRTASEPRHPATVRAAPRAEPAGRA